MQLSAITLASKHEAKKFEALKSSLSIGQFAGLHLEISAAAGALWSSSSDAIRKSGVCCSWWAIQ